jgi:hypothetical protein
MLSKEGYPTPVLVILEDGVVIFLLIIQDHYLSDSLPKTQIISKWQLAFLQNRGERR